MTRFISRCTVIGCLIVCLLSIAVAECEEPPVTREAGSAIREILGRGNSWYQEREAAKKLKEMASARFQPVYTSCQSSRRVWTTKQYGAVYAQLVRASTYHASFRTDDGKVHLVKMRDLIERDQQWIREAKAYAVKQRAIARLAARRKR